LDIIKAITKKRTKTKRLLINVWRSNWNVKKDIFTQMNMNNMNSCTTFRKSNRQVLLYLKIFKRPKIYGENHLSNHKNPSKQDPIFFRVGLMYIIFKNKKNSRNFEVLIVLTIWKWIYFLFILLLLCFLIKLKKF